MRYLFAVVLAGLLTACSMPSWVPQGSINDPGLHPGQPVVQSADHVQLPISGRIVTKAEACEVGREFLANAAVIARLFASNPARIDAARALARPFARILVSPYCRTPVPPWLETELQEPAALEAPTANESPSS